MSDAPIRLVSPTMRRLAIVLWIVAIALIPIGLVTSGVRALWFAPAPSVFTAVFAWLVLWRPRIEIRSDRLVVVDVRRQTSMAWSRVLEVRSRYGIEIRTSEGVRRTWIATTQKSRLAIIAERGGDHARLDIEQAASVIRERIPAAVEIDGPPPASVTAAPIVTRIHGWAVVLLIALGIAASMTGSRI